MPKAKPVVKPSPAPKAEPSQPVEKPQPTEKPRPRFVETMKHVSNILAEFPNCITVHRVKDEHGYYYKWVEPKSKAREEVRKVLRFMWRHSSDQFNYHMIAERLRVKTEDVQAVLDEDFRFDNGL